MIKALAFGVSLMLTLCSSTAQAHANDATGFASVAIRDNTVSYQLTPTALAQTGPAVTVSLLRDKLHVSADGKACPAASPDTKPDTPPGLQLRFVCDAAPRTLTLQDDLADTLGTSHHIIALATWSGGSQSLVFSGSSRSATLNMQAATDTTTHNTVESASGFFKLGVWHIATGYDHLLFLLALILGGGNVRALVKIITAFTLAHSLTLGAAALDLISFAPTVVEALIALSIAYVAFENLFPRFALSRRWTISLLFGLVHGFGFSSVLKEIGLPQDSLVLALLNFNLGVEAGQLLAVLLVVPVLVALKKTRWHDRVVTTVSALVLLVGVALFVERVVWGV